jgi:hypothetical protein
MEIKNSTSSINGVPILVESERGCGYRKEGGLYMISGKLSAPCCFLPFELPICPTCHSGVKFSRGFTWIEAGKILRASKREPECIYNEDGILAKTVQLCIVRTMRQTWEEERAGLIWVGEKFYKTPADFIKECAEKGFSRRIPTLPKDFKSGETWILCAHKKAIHDQEEDKYYSGIICVTKPTEIQKVVSKEDTANEFEMQMLRKRGIQPVVVERDIEQTEIH